MHARTLVLVLCWAVIGTSLALPDGDTPAPARRGARAGDESRATGPSAFLEEDDARDVNPNNVIGNFCARGFVRLPNGACVRAEQPPSSGALLPPQGFGEDDDEEFIRRVLGANTGPRSSVGSGANPSVAIVPTPTSAESVPNTQSVPEFLDSLSDEDFLEGLLEGLPDDAEDSDSAPSPGKEPTSCAERALYHRGLILVCVGSVLLVLSLLVAVWTALRWCCRQRKASGANFII